MNIIISGYGRMGRAVESVARQRQHSIIARFDRPGDWEGLKDLTGQAPLVIDFSQPDAVVDNINRCFRYRVPVVTGPTGWNQHLPEVRRACEEDGQTLLAASNFSIGMNLFFAVNSYLASLMDGQEGYEPSIRETHHIHKLDKPSGTAITLAEQLVRQLIRKNKWVPGVPAAPDQLGIESVREGEVFGEHEVTWGSSSDRITLRHEATSRQGFAEGAVLAAEWLRGRTGYFEMKDFLGI